MKTFITICLVMLASASFSQVKIGDNPTTINSNSMLEIESTNKGFLPPRIALNDASSIAPLTGTVPAGMLVFSTGGTLTDGYYFWNGSAWKLVATSTMNLATKTASATLLKKENMVLASNDITITLPAVTASDNGLEITVKNVGVPKDLVKVIGSSTSTIDANDSALLTRNKAATFVASAGNWLIKRKDNLPENILEVNRNSSWTTLQEAMDFLKAHMSGPTVVRLAQETYEVSSTITVDLPYDLTFQGLSFGTSTVTPASGLSGPMFRCKSACFFKMLQFDGGSGSYGTNAGEDAIRFVGADTYNEIKDSYFSHFYNAIIDSSNAELWVFETDITNAANNGILIHSNLSGVTVKVAETDFISCKTGINLSKASGATIQLASGGYFNANAGDVAILYQPNTFTAFANISITGNSWNNIGKYIDGFDFTRTDGRDANATIVSNAGSADKQPNCTMGVTNNVTSTSLTSNSNWYKINWTNTSSATCKWTVGNNRITYQPANRRDAYIIISGNIQSSSSTATLNIGMVKNPTGTSGSSASIVRYGETTLRPGTANQPFQFSVVVNLTDIGPNDYFELWANSTVSLSSITIQDVQWLVNTR